MHVKGKVEWHQQIGDMVSRDLIQGTFDLGNLQNMVTKLVEQIKQVKIINNSRMVIVQELEDKVVDLETYK
jgi:hypothetical protein